MAQSDQTIQNATFPAVRADINDNLAALFSQSSGPSDPAVTIGVTVAYQPWIDTSGLPASPALWKIRNGANTGWITVGSIGTDFSIGGVTAIANGGTGATTATAALTALLPTQTGNGGRYLSTDGTVTSWALAAAGAALQVFTATGTYTPTAGKTTFLVFATGGGGGGDTYAGGAGGTALRIYTAAEMGASAAITIGAGGTSGGSAGGSTSFDPAGTGLTITGAGGGGGSAATAGAGGGATNSQLAINGQPGIGNVAGGVSFWAGGRGRGGQPSNVGTGGAVLVLEF